MAASISYSRKVFIPLTKLCRDVCHYCTFAESAARRAQRLPLARGGAGDRPRRRRGRLHRGAVHPRRQAGAALAPGARGAGGAGARDDHRLPGRHVRAGAEGDRAAAARQPRRDDAATRSPRCARSPPARASCWKAPARGSASPARSHHGSPDKHPAARLEVLRLAGELRVPFTTGILIGIGETRAERIEALLAIARSARAARPYPGSHHPELPRQAGHQAGGGGGAGPRRPALDHRRGAAGAGRGDAHPGAAQPLARRLPAAGRGGSERLGRRLPGDARPCEPGGALAASGGAGRRAPPRPARCWCSGCRSIPTTSARPSAGSRPRSPPRCAAPATPKASRAATTGRPARRRCRCCRRRAWPRPMRRWPASWTAPPAARGSIAPRDHARCSPRAMPTRRMSPRRPTRCARDVRRDDPLRRQPQHQLHQHLHLPLHVLRLLQGQDARGAARPGLRPRPCARSSAAPRRPGPAARPRSACRAASTRTTPARPMTAICRAIKRRAAGACTSTPSRRWK